MKQKSKSALMDEAELVSRARAGETWALNKLLEQVYPGLCRMARHTLFHEADALDAVQDAMIKAAANLARLDDPVAFPLWIRTILRNCCVDVIRSRKFGPDACLSFEQVGAEADWCAFSDDRVEETICVDQLIAQLGESAAEIVCLRDYLGLTVREAARHLGVSDGAIKARLHRARRKALKLIA